LRAAIATALRILSDELGESGVTWGLPVDLNPLEERIMFYTAAEGASAPSGLYGSQPGV
jgi:hypothetical protein